MVYVMFFGSKKSDATRAPETGAPEQAIITNKEETLVISKDESVRFVPKTQSQNQSTDTNQYLNYPGVKAVLAKAQNCLDKKQKLIFSTVNCFMNSQAEQFFLDSESQRKHLLEDWEGTYKPFLDRSINQKIGLCFSSSLVKNIEELNKGEYFSAHVKELSLGTLATHFSSILNKRVAGQKVLGDYSLAYVSARANSEYRKHFLQNKAIDHFYFAEGICNINTFADVLKAHEISKNDLVVLMLPENSIKAFRKDKFSEWQELKTEMQPANFYDGKLYHCDKNGNTLNEINLIEHKVTNLNDSIYKVKAGEYWVVVVPVSNSSTEIYNQDKKSALNKLQDKINLRHEKFEYTSVDFTDIPGSPEQSEEHYAQNPELHVENFDIKDLINNGTESIDILREIIEEAYAQEDIISCSVGQAARAIFKLKGGTFDDIAEVMLNADGGSFNSLVTEKSSDGRHMGVNNMHDVIKNKWFKHTDVAIPSNYLGFDRLGITNKHLLEEENIYALATSNDDSISLEEKLVFIEAPQHWKKVSNELVQYVTKTVYREFSNVASRKYHLSLKDLIDLVARYLGIAAIYDESSEKYAKAVAGLEAPEELLSFLKLISYAHYALSSSADFFSTKTSKSSMLRLQWIAKIHKALHALAPDLVDRFQDRLNTILAADMKSELTILADLYYSELNKLS